MEEVTTSKWNRIQDTVFKYLPLIILGFVILMTGLSFIGDLFVVSYYKGDDLIVLPISLSTLLFTHGAGINAQVYFIIHFFVLPLIACVLLIFSKNHKYFKVAAMIIFLTLFVSSIVIKDLYTETIYRYYRLIYETKYAFEVSDLSFVYFLPVVCYFVSFGITGLLSFKDINFAAKDITEMGVLIAAAIGLNFIKILPMPTGGSVNLQMLPLFFLALRRGPLKGFIGGGIVFGLITCLSDGYGFATYPFDYLLGFGSIAVFGFFSPYILVPGEKKYTLRGELLLLAAGVISTTIRFIAGTVSSMVIYSYDLVPAMAYNSLYIFVSGAMSLAIIMALLGPIRRVNSHFPVEPEHLY